MRLPGPLVVGERRSIGNAPTHTLEAVVPARPARQRGFSDAMAQAALLRHGWLLLMRLYPGPYKCLWHSRPSFYGTAELMMNLVVASRHDGPHMRFDVQGRWQN